jgi:hypothetical protein
MFPGCPQTMLIKYSLACGRILNFLHFSLPDSPYSTYQYSNIKERKEILQSVANRPTSSGHVGLLTKDMAP